MLLENDFVHDLRVKREVRALAGAGYKLIIAGITQKGEDSITSENDYILYIRKISPLIYKSSVAALKFPLYFNFWKKYARGIFLDNLIDFIHVHDLPLCSVGVWIREKYGVKFIADLHENWPALLSSSLHTKTIAGRLLSSDREWRKYEKRMVREADLLITIVEEAGERLAGLGVPAERISIVSNTFDPGEISAEPHAAGQANKEFTLFYGGAINWHRGLQVVFEAIKLLAGKNIIIRMNLVGSGSFKPELENLSDNYGIKNQIVFYGHKPASEMFAVLDESDAAIIPHLRTENNDASSPNKLYQYMFYGKCVISSDCTSLKRIISETDCGFSYNADSAGALSALLENIAGNKEILRQKGSNGRNAVLNKYNWTNDAQKLIAGYERFSE